MRVSEWLARGMMPKGGVSYVDAAALDQGWEVDSSGGFIVVKAKPAAPSAGATEEDLAKLAEYVVFLES